MVRAKKGCKKDVDYYEYQDGYRLIIDSEIEAVIGLYAEGRWKKNELRVYAGMQEHAALHKSSKVDLYRIVNSETAKRGIKRLSNKEIEDACGVVESTLPKESPGQKKPVARKFLRHIAKGAASCSEAIVLFYYCHQRIRQPKKYARLNEGERFARFTYRELSGLSGLRKASISEGLKRLVDRQLLNTVDVAKQSENYYGMLFVDGAVVSLTRKGPENRPNKSKRKETVTPPEEKRMPPQGKTVTLKNKEPKTDIVAGPLRDQRLALRDSMTRLLRSPIDSIRQSAERALMEMESKQQQAA